MLFSTSSSVCLSVRVLLLLFFLSLSLSLPQFLTSFVSVFPSDANVHAFTGNVTQIQTYQDFTGLFSDNCGPKKCLSFERLFSKIVILMWHYRCCFAVEIMQLVTVQVQLSLIVLVHNNSAH